MKAKINGIEIEADVNEMKELLSLEQNNSVPELDSVPVFEDSFKELPAFPELGKVPKGKVDIVLKNTKNKQKSEWGKCGKDKKQDIDNAIEYMIRNPGVGTR